MTAEDKEATIQKACQLARDYDKQYGCCPQCVLAAIKETAGIVTDDVIKASHGLSGGGGITSGWHALSRRRAWLAATMPTASLWACHTPGGRQRA